MLTLDGFDPASGKMRGDGFISLVSAGVAEPAAVWPFADLLKHWGRKHAKAVYVPSLLRREPQLSFRYGGIVRFGEGTDFLRFLRAISQGAVYYDPGIKLVESEGRVLVKRRSQFRIASGDLSQLYTSMTIEAVT